MSRKMIESMQREASKLDKSNHTEAKKAERGDQRKRKRLAPFNELSARNKGLNATATDLLRVTANNKAPQDRRTGNWFFVTPEAGKEGYAIIGRLLEDANYDERPRRINLDLYSISAATFEQLKAQPYTPNIPLIERKSKTAYRVSKSNDFRDEIQEAGEDRAPERSFSPVSALRRVYKLGRIEDHLDDLEATIEIFKEAIEDRELNAHLYAAPEVVEAAQPQFRW